MYIYIYIYIYVCMYIKSVKQKGKLSNKSKIHLILLEKEKTLRKPYFIGTQNLQDTNTEK